MQFCLGVLNNVLHVFHWSLLPFWDIMYAKKHRASSGDLLNQKQKKPFVSLRDEVTKVWHLLLVEGLAASLF